RLLSVSLSPGTGGTVTSNPPGIVCGVGGSVCSYEFPYGSNVSLTVNAAQGWSFADWRGACNGKGACTVNLIRSQTVSARLAPTQSWQLVGTGDFNGDRTTDLLFYHPPTGTIAQWQMQKGVASYQRVGWAGAEWRD